MAAGTGPAPPRDERGGRWVYKFVELSIVTDQTIEECVNDWVGQGWTFDGVRFVTTEASRRPAMAFVSFVSAPVSPSPSTRRRRR